MCGSLLMRIVDEKRESLNQSAATLREREGPGIYVGFPALFFMKSMKMSRVARSWKKV